MKGSGRVVGGVSGSRSSSVVNPQPRQNETLAPCPRPNATERACAAYSTVTDFARLRGWSTSVPFSTATW